MSDSVSQYLKEKVFARKSEGNYRSLFLSGNNIDFFSNDYLGIATQNSLKPLIEKKIQEFDKSPRLYGATGSRLLSGNTSFAEELEHSLAQMHQSEAALLFPSGYMANLGVLSSIPYKNATIIYDELVHASMHDGIRMSRAKSLSFFHNDLNDLQDKLKKADGLKLIAIEALYSMDGDFAPLGEIVSLAKEYDAAIILDEAHSTGIYGQKGEGLAQVQNLHRDIFVRIHTFGKAPGVHGAVVLCNEVTKHFLINYCRPFIFSTAMPLHSLVAIYASYEFMATAACHAHRERLNEVIKFFTNQYENIFGNENCKSNSAIQTVIIPGNDKCRNLSLKLIEKGFEIRPILSPTVPKGKERLRICLHSFNTFEQIEELFIFLKKIYNNEW